MPDLRDGESVEMQGSASRPYVLKNVGGVYSCSCPAWRNQSLPIEQRTCKHLRKLRGDAAEASRLGRLVPVAATTGRDKPTAPALLLAETWDGTADPTGWWLSEKLDGVRAFWDGRRFLSRQGNQYFAPAWFTDSLPPVLLDGELWLARKQFQRTVSIVRRHDQTDLWREIRFLAFDAPDIRGTFEERQDYLRQIIEQMQPAFAQVHPQTRCHGAPHVRAELARILAMGGEGVMLRQPGSGYVAGRSTTLLKVKQFQEADARVIAYQPGTGRHKGRLGALLAELPDGTQFAVGTGFSDVQREKPPALGSTITFRFQELSGGGVPRFPVFVDVRLEEPQAVTHNHRGESHLATTTTKRRFEFVEGTSDKFWETEVNGTSVTVRFGRNGTAGQATIKQFADAAKAEKHVQKMIQEKLRKGYREVG